MDVAKLGAKIQNKRCPQDCYYTPLPLARKLIEMVPLQKDDVVLDPCRGKGVFYDNYPEYVIKDWCEIEEEKDFLHYNKKVDWCVSNPPFSLFDKWLEKTVSICKKGFAYIFGLFNLTMRRLEFINQSGFYLTHFHIFKVKGWFGRSSFLIFQKGHKNIITYDVKPYGTRMGDLAIERVSGYEDIKKFL